MLRLDLENLILVLGDVLLFNIIISLKVSSTTNSHLDFDLKQIFHSLLLSWTQRVDSQLRVWRFTLCFQYALSIDYSPLLYKQFAVYVIFPFDWINYLSCSMYQNLIFFNRVFLFLWFNFLEYFFFNNLYYLM